MKKKLAAIASIIVIVIVYMTIGSSPSDLEHSRQLKTLKKSKPYVYKSTPQIDFDISELKAERRTVHSAIYSERPRDEWQGMLVDISNPIKCQDFCGLALACLGGECSPCSHDNDCLKNEMCVLDHCLLEKNVECRSSKDCSNALCVLNGYSYGARGNKDMRSQCLDSDKIFHQVPFEEPDVDTVVAKPSPISFDKLKRIVQETQ